MNKNYTQDLFQLQTELTDMKVDMAVGKAIDRVLQKIDDLRLEIHDLRLEMNHRFSEMNSRVVAIEIKLGIIGEKKKSIYDRMLDYIFKAGYGALTFISLYFAFLLSQMHLVH